jgi:nucleotide-binding universal stress UspA family protein
MNPRLMVLIDFSPQTEVILKLAKRWSEIIKAEILLIHQVTYAVPALADSDTRTKIIQFEKGKVNTELNNLIRKHFGKTDTVDFEIFEKNLIPSLKKLVGKKFNDIVMLGTEGSGILKKYFMGSTALKIIDELNWLTITVPPFYETHFPQTLTVAVTHKYPLNRKIFSNFLGTIQNFIEQVHFLSIVTPGENVKKAHEYLLNLTQECEHNIPCTYDLFEGSSAFDAVKNFVLDNPNTLLVVQKGSRNLSDHLFRKFFINDLVYDSSLPLIIIPQ